MAVPLRLGTWNLPLSLLTHSFKTVVKKHEGKETPARVVGVTRWFCVFPTYLYLLQSSVLLHYFCFRLRKAWWDPAHDLCATLPASSRVSKLARVTASTAYQVWSSDRFGTSIQKIINNNSSEKLSCLFSFSFKVKKTKCALEIADLFFILKETEEEEERRKKKRKKRKKLFLIRNRSPQLKRFLKQVRLPSMTS